MAEQSYKIYQIPLPHYLHFRFMLREQGILYQEIFRLSCVYMRVQAASDHHEAFGGMVEDFDVEERRLRYPLRIEELVQEEVSGWRSLQVLYVGRTRSRCEVVVRGPGETLDMLEQSIARKRRRLRKAEVRAPLRAPVTASEA
jgi:hypothetical protein